MKKAWCIFLFALTFSAVQAQTETEKSAAQKDTESLVQQYNLDEAQAAEMLVVMERKYRNLAEFEPLKFEDTQAYLRKLRALIIATDASFRRILKGDQLTLYNQKQAALRKEKAERYQQLRKEGASQTEIDKEMIAIDLRGMQ